MACVLSTGSGGVVSLAVRVRNTTRLEYLPPSWIQIANVYSASAVRPKPVRAWWSVETATA